MSEPKTILRDEHKFLINYAQMNAIIERIRPRMMKDPHTDEFSTTPIMSLYYDSPHFDFVREKIDGNEFRNKLRLRCYDTEFKKGQTVFIEIKQRLFDKVRKVRCKIPDFDPAKHFDPANWEFVTDEQKNNFGLLLEQFLPRPAAKIFYLRKAFMGTCSPSLRITFDSQILSLHPEEHVCSEIILDQSRYIIPDTLTVLEIKTTDKLPGWVPDLVRDFNLVQRPIPKYVSGVEKLNVQNLCSFGDYI